ncbi:DUF883 family protein [Bradymonas sediminis]|uniref:Uncharacterized protein n=1 Tax=Bradymonas sediminis TaxID=1548548 RepID=A0A2Z4FGA9_9DELT|nr:DUF883 family protein [Bradymonas sediminis]AWV87959.1 hypothetical protein DN745_00885 [Bradymonas sediminis]TDP62979.1 ElaB/YqjD/DUF883 family membrane-anchored ribosome-binding protein [Bradymonas sediminis]
MSIDSPKSGANLGVNLGDPVALDPADFDAAAAAAGEDGADLRERARDVQERIEEGFHEMEARYDDARDQLRTINDQAVEFIRENPALCVAGAIGVGYLLGKLAKKRWLV